MSISSIGNGTSTKSGAGAGTGAATGSQSGTGTSSAGSLIYPFLAGHPVKVQRRYSTKTPKNRVKVECTQYELLGTIARFEICGRECLCTDPVLSGFPCAYVCVTEDLATVRGKDGQLLTLEDLEDVPAYGGITYTGDLTRYSAEGDWVGIDLSHSNDMGFRCVEREFDDILGITLSGHAIEFGNMRSLDDAIMRGEQLAESVDEFISAFSREPVRRGSIVDRMRQSIGRMIP